MRPLPQLRGKFWISVPLGSDMWAHDRDVGHYPMHLKVGLRAFLAIEEGFFDEKNRMLSREAREKLLRALPDEAPAKVREDDDAVAVGGFFVGGLGARNGFRLRTRGRAVAFGGFSFRSRGSAFQDRIVCLCL